VVYRHGGSIDFFEATELSEQSLLAGLTEEELTDLASLAAIRTLSAEPEDHQGPAIPRPSLFFLRSGVVHVTLPDGIRLATLTAGMPVRAKWRCWNRAARRTCSPIWRRPRLRGSAARFRTLPPAAPPRRRTDHAQPRPTARRPPDRRQCQGESADVELAGVWRRAVNFQSDIEHHPRYCLEVWEIRQIQQFQPLCRRY